MATRGKDAIRATTSPRQRLEVPTPPARSLQVYAIDPSTGDTRRTHMTSRFPGSRLRRGQPAGRSRSSTMTPPTSATTRRSISTTPSLLANDGLNPSESDPRFHQQMVYAIASRTIQMFEAALGREIHWRRADRFGGVRRE